MKLVFTILWSIMFGFFMKSQKLSSYEKCWAIGHPFAAVKVKKISKRCYKIYNKITTNKQLDTFSNGGTLDAFRHAFFMAAFAQKIKVKKLNKLGIAHEKGNYKQFLKNEYENNELPDSIATVMDLKNNALGFIIAQKHKTESLDKIFDPFYTTKPVGEGTGLGLSVSYGIIQSHQGEIKVESAPGRGTKFIIYIPA